MPNVFCAWCGKPMGHKTWLYGKVSHGICPSCANKQLATIKKQTM